MATYTDNYQLTKPTMAEVADVRTINNNMDKVDDIMHASQVSIANAYSHLNTYKKGDMVMYEKLLYECITAVDTPETWDETKWRRAVAVDAKPSVMTGATSTDDGESGLVPAPLSSDRDKYLKGDGTWDDPPGGGGSGNVDDVYENGVSVLGQDHIARTKSYKVLTQAEYDALPASKLTDGIMYCISDSGPVEGDQFAPVIYSLEERQIGTWTDGKPLYQKTIHIASIPSESYDYFDIADDIDSVVNVQGMVNGITPIYMNRPDSVTSEFSIQIAEQSGEKKLFFRSHRSATGYADITCLYTKTTDTPGSGEWTPSGVPAHHYSTEEQVVGTWIDGSTVYEKTEVIDLTSSPLDGAAESTVQLSAFNSADLITDIKVIGKYKSDKATPDYNVIIQYTGGVKTIIDSGRELVNYSNDALTIYMGNNYKNWGAGADNRICMLYVTIQYTKSS